MFTVDKYLDRSYDFDKYNCGHFVAEVWKDLTNEDITNICDLFVSDGEQFIDCLKIRERIKEPENPCVVIMNPFGITQAVPHAGVYVDRSVLHLTQSGATYQPLETLQPFFKMHYYK